MIMYKGYKVTRSGEVYNKDGTLKKLNKNSSGYYRFKIYDEGKMVERCFVHRIVAKLFIPKVEGHTIVNHIDGDKLNNHYKNLQWSTYTKNLKHAYRKGLRKPRGYQTPNAKLEISEVSEIKELLRSGKLSQSEIARRFDLSRSSVNHIKQGKTWKNVN